MAVPQWFPMYPTDFLVSTAAMTPTQGWAYTQMLLFSWTNHALPDDREACARLTRCDLTEADWSVLRARFKATPEGLVNARLERERMAAQERADRASASGRVGAERRWRHGNPNGNPNGVPNGTPNGNPNGETMAATTTTTHTPHLTVGGSRGEGRVNSSKQADSSPAASTAGGLGGAVSRPGGQDGSTPHPTPSDAPTGIVRVSAIGRMRNPTGEEMQRITRWPGNRRTPQEAIDAKRNWLEKAMTAKGIDPDLRVAAWEAAVANWVATGIDPYEYVKDTLLSDWVDVRSPNAVIRHRLGMTHAA